MLWLVLLGLVYGACFEITSPGYYELTSDIPSASSEQLCINITSSDVVLNLNSYSIGENNSINITAASNITLANGTILSSIYIGSLEQLRLENLTLINGALWSDNLSFVYIEEARLENFTLANKEILFHLSLENITIKEGYGVNTSVLYNLEASDLFIQNGRFLYVENESENISIKDVYLGNASLASLAHTTNSLIQNITGYGTSSMLSYKVLETNTTNLTIKDVYGWGYVYGISCGGWLSFGGDVPAVYELNIFNVRLENISREGFIGIGCGEINSVYSNITLFNISEIGKLTIGSMENLTYQGWYVRMEDLDAGANANMGFTLFGLSSNLTLKDILIERGNGYGVFLQSTFIGGKNMMENITIQDLPIGIFVIYSLEGEGDISLSHIQTRNLTYGIAFVDYNLNATIQHSSLEAEYPLLFGTEDLPFHTASAQVIDVTLSNPIFYYNGEGNLSLVDVSSEELLYVVNSSLFIYDSKAQGTISGENLSLNISNSSFTGNSIFSFFNITNSYWSNVVGRNFRYNGTYVKDSSNLLWENVTMCSPYSDQSFILEQSTNITGSVVGKVINLSSDYELDVRPCVFKPPRKNRPPEIEIYLPEPITYNTTLINFSIWGEDR
ncbi:MAG: hypothetical protein GXN92_00405, partial [Candidatus Micrarchaeota archaeon]|nr:hypothetical protein [Candidatus Micrarchaeota archaeon]